MSGHDFTPHELGVLHGLTDNWGSNPYREGRNLPDRDYDRYIEGRAIGLELREIAKERRNREAST